MFFWFKRKKIVLDCFTYDSIVYDRHKIQKAVYSLPDWFKNLDINIPGNMKYCEGFKQYFKNAISLNMWCTLDFHIDSKNKKWEWNAAMPLRAHGEHKPKQYGSFLPPDNYDHFKIGTPWFFKTSRHVKFAWVDSFWCRNTMAYFFPNAIVDYFYQHTTDVNMFFSYGDKPYSFTIQAGQPMIFLIPLTEEKVEIRNHLVSVQEIERYAPVDVGVSSAFNRYQIRKKHTDKLLSQQKKCPFGFGNKDEI